MLAIGDALTRCHAKKCASPSGLMRALRRALVISMFLIIGCASTPTHLCADRHVRIDVSFEGAGNHTCWLASREHFVLSVRPEGRPINPSPWYAFRVRADEASRVNITLRYEDAAHRYQPKIAQEGQPWRDLNPSALRVDADQNSATFSVNLERGVNYIAAQPIETPRQTLAWARRLLLGAGFREFEYGRSIDGRALVAFTSGSGEGLIVAITRQHPPETQGSVAFRAFAERIASNAEDARALRAANRIVLAPMPNPDGVVRGHWRHNAGGVDLNRDWLTMSQPETRALASLIEREAAGRRVRSFIDFHATRRNVIYAPPRDAASPDIALLAVLESRFRADLARPPAWSYDHHANSGVSKAWALERLAAPGITLEVADTATQEEARAIGRAAADALIEYLNGS